MTKGMHVSFVADVQKQIEVSEVIAALWRGHHPDCCVLRHKRQFRS